MAKILFYAQDENVFDSICNFSESSNDFDITRIFSIGEAKNYVDDCDVDVIMIQSNLEDKIETSQYLEVSEHYTKLNREMKFLLIIDDIRKVAEHSKLRIDAVLGNNVDNETISHTITSFFEKEVVHKTVLLVDDTKFIHLMVTDKLKPFGYNILSSYDGVDGLQKAIESRPDLIITDVEMPGKDGFQLCKELKQISFLKNIPVMILTSLDSKDDVKRGFDVGCDDYLKKPFKIEELLSRIDILLKDATIYGREKILVIDDSDFIRDMIVRTLKKQGFKSVEAKDGLEGFHMAINVKPDIIITDCEMPQLGGKDMAKMLSNNSNTKDIPIIMLSGKDTKEDIVECYTSGIVSFASKPFSPDNILVLVERVAAELRFNREKKILSHYVSESTITEARKKACFRKNDEKFFSTTDSVAIMFSDIVKFTDLSESLETQSVVSLLNDYFDCMTDILKEESGEVDKFIGDAIMALFFTKDNFDHACVRAVRTSIRMIEALNIFNQGREHKIAIRLGLNFGPVIIGDIGSKNYRRDFTVIGDNVNLASRLESINKQYGSQIIISENTYKHLNGMFLVRKLDRIRVKGKNNAVDIYEVLTDQSKVNDVAIYETGLGHYFAGEWLKAIECFGEISNDYAAQVLMERCKTYHASGKSENWDGVHVMTSK